MREILFRGKRYDDKNFILSDSIMQTSYGCVNLWHEGKWIEVIPRTVGQYTGLKDRNGTKIFEGDIVRVFDVWCGGVKKVVWWESEASFKLNKDGKTYLCLDTAIEKGCKVIGNIHDNPELLNAEGVK